MQRLMTRIALTLIVFMAPGMAAAAERSYSVTDFERIRIEGPFDVKLVIGKPPSARAQADQRTLDLLKLRVESATLIVAMGGSGWGETPKAVRSAPIITITTHNLRVAMVNAGGRLQIDRMNGQRLDLVVHGNGVLTVNSVKADQLNATLIGSGSIILAGRTGRANLLSNGTGVVDAGALTANDLKIMLDGPGEVKAAARYTARITSTGIGKVSVSGNPSCTVTAVAGGPVICGAN